MLSSCRTLDESMFPESDSKKSCMLCIPEQGGINESNLQSPVPTYQASKNQPVRVDRETYFSLGRSKPPGSCLTKCLVSELQSSRMRLENQKRNRPGSDDVAVTVNGLHLLGWETVRNQSSGTISHSKR